MFYTTEQLGPKRSVTPEGFLICRDVPIGRTGTQLYSALEVPVETKNGEVRVIRDADQVFRAETIASFEGKPVTLTHPDEFVSPDNWASYAVGTLQNVRQGQNPFDDLLIADLVVTRRDAIDAVNEGLREVSCGYDAEYEALEPGKARQINIVGNHVALVERGRAGSRCAIQDEATIVSTKDKAKFWDRIKAALSTNDAEAIKAAVADEEADPMNKVLDALEGIGTRLAALEGGQTADEDKDPEDPAKVEAKDGEESEEEKAAREAEDMLITPESAPKADIGRVWTGDALLEVVARAEILAPGIAIPTADAAMKAPAVAVAKLQRKALTKAAATADSAKAVEAFLNGRKIDALTLDALDAVFVGAAELIRKQNNDALQSLNGARMLDAGTKRPPSIADINAANRNHWQAAK